MTTLAPTTLLVFARCIGLVVRAPGFSHPSVPAPLRAGLALVLTLAIAPAVPTSPTFAHEPVNAIALIVALLSEFLFGGAIGTAAALLYDGAYAGGRVLDDYVGMKAVAPSLELVAPSGFGRLWSSVFTGGYMLFGAYRLPLLAFAQSFTRVPPGSAFDAHAWAPFVMTLASTIVVVALSVAAPAIALAFVVHVALGALSRTIPRFSSFTLAFPLVFGTVVIVTAMTVPLIAQRAAHPLVLIPAGAR